MKIVNRTSILAGVAMMLLSSCAALKDAFPDKHEDYKQSSELPALEVPPDLTTSSIEDPTMQKPDASGVASYSELVNKTTVSGDDDTASETAEQQADAKPSTQLSAEDEGAFLELKETFPRAWRLVGKSLSNLEIEVVDRNRSIGMYYVLYDESGSGQASGKRWWSRLAFWRDVAIQQKEAQYRVKLEEWDEITKVFVLDAEGEKQANGIGLNLLKKIEEKLAEK